MLTKAISCFHILQMTIYSGTSGFWGEKMASRKLQTWPQVIKHKDALFVQLYFIVIDKHLIKVVGIL